MTILIGTAPALLMLLGLLLIPFGLPGLWLVVAVAVALALMTHSTRVGWGVVLARTIAVVLKVGTALAIAAAAGVAAVL